MIHQELLDSAVRGAPAEEQRKKLAERVTWPSCGAGSGGHMGSQLGIKDGNEKSTINGSL